jgi:hypothetical protein
MWCRWATPMGDLDADGVMLETLRRDQGGPERLIEVLAAAFFHGLPVNWTGLLPGRHGKPHHEPGADYFASLQDPAFELADLRQDPPPHQGHRPAPGETSCLTLVWAVLDRAARGWRGLTMTADGLRLRQDLRRSVLDPPRQLRPRTVTPTGDDEPSSTTHRASRSRPVSASGALRLGIENQLVISHQVRAPRSTTPIGEMTSTLDR